MRTRTTRPGWRRSGCCATGNGKRGGAGCSRETCGPTTRQFRLDRSVVGPGVPLTDAQWARIEPLLPDPTPKRGGRWRDRRQVIDAIAFKFQTGTQWVHLPDKCGNWRGVYNRLRCGPSRAPGSGSSPL
ncbi:transposase [Streptomyces mirabilis]|uniref:transposase n=1 Tax=Streptomyces mirabilis TaxID=68239 RepID=UPI0036432AEE